MPRTPVEHDSSESASPYPSRSTSRRSVPGYERCPHQCSNQPCYSNKRGPLWPKEGNSLARHMKRVNLHPQCTPACRAHQLNMGNGTLPELSLSMRPTVADFETALKMINDPAIKEEINSYMLSSVWIAQYIL